MIFVGIDIAKDKHDCFISNSDGEVLFNAFTITNSLEGFNDLYQKISSLTRDFSNIKVGLDILIGLLMGYMELAQIGILLFAVVVFFQLVTLPVEFNASRRALAILSGNNILWEEEMRGARKVLTAAALTYVASLFSSILQMLRLILIVGRRDQR